RGGERLVQLRGAEFSAGASGARHAGHAVRRRTGAQAAARPADAAHAHLAGADPRDEGAAAAAAHLVPGKVHRRDTPDATHSPVFHQVEGLAVDTNIT